MSDGVPHECAAFSQRSGYSEISVFFVLALLTGFKSAQALSDIFINQSEYNNITIRSRIRWQIVGIFACVIREAPWSVKSNQTCTVMMEQISNISFNKASITATITKVVKSNWQHFNEESTRTGKILTNPDLCSLYFKTIIYLLCCLAWHCQANLQMHISREALSSFLFPRGVINECRLLTQLECFPHIDFSWMGHPGIFSQVYLAISYSMFYMYSYICRREQHHNPQINLHASSEGVWAIFKQENMAARSQMFSN